MTKNNAGPKMTKNNAGPKMTKNNAEPNMTKNNAGPNMTKNNAGQLYVTLSRSEWCLNISSDSPNFLNFLSRMLYI